MQNSRELFVLLGNLYTGTCDTPLSLYVDGWEFHRLPILAHLCHYASQKVRVTTFPGTVNAKLPTLTFRPHRWWAPHKRNVDDVSWTTPPALLNQSFFSSHQPCEGELWHIDFKITSRKQTSALLCGHFSAEWFLELQRSCCWEPFFSQLCFLTTSRLLQAVGRAWGGASQPESDLSVCTHLINDANYYEHKRQEPLWRLWCFTRRLHPSSIISSTPVSHQSCP